MSISSEIESIRAELTRLQTKLIILESRLKPDSSALATKITSVSTINKVSQSRHCKTIGRSDKALCAVKAGDSKTLRSRSFRVMRHLIAMVDVSHAEASPDRSNAPSDRGRHRDLPNLPQSTTGKKLKPKQNNNPKVPRRQSKTFTARNTVQTTKPINNSTSHVTVQPFLLIPQMATLHDVIKAEYQGLCFPSDQSLKTKYVFQDKRWRVSADKLHTRANKLIKKGAAGIWLWNQEMEAADYRSLTKTTATRSQDVKTLLQFSGWATEGPPGHSPPSIEKIPIKLFENVKGRTWCWYKDRWLLFLLHKT
ncbi:hypothetical protein MJO28_009351 [Puccinia striiformis f. sp. tritici]|uniref:Uncharacterized protein n=1 Tax=Puccinia striiformis f. sp. tritici TaxID=168172 RepID=A0ACC0E7L3_9BASI|nr:hypothetical protein MJO28_009351 [Puccinia striiformis f. sp. tritici]